MGPSTGRDPLNFRQSDSTASPPQPHQHSGPVVNAQRDPSEFHQSVSSDGNYNAPTKYNFNFPDPLKLPQPRLMKPMSGVKLIHSLRQM